jgi:hypothetical protein
MLCEEGELLDSTSNKAKFKQPFLKAPFNTHFFRPRTECLLVAALVLPKARFFLSHTKREKCQRIGVVAFVGPAFKSRF